MFIELFEKKYRGPVINIILNAIRSGCSYSGDVIDWVKKDLIRRKKYRKLSDYLTVLESNLDNDLIYPFIEDYIKYQDLPYEDKQKVKKIKINAKNMQKKLLKDIINEKRPMSWSCISAWRYSKEDWYEKYIENKQQKTSAEMLWGSKIGKKLETDPTYLPQIPRHNKMEHPFSVVFGGIPLCGYADSFCTITKKKLLEFKTGVKAWDQKRADEHQQIDMYLLMNYITNKIKPEEVEVQLVWLPTKKESTGDFVDTISFVEPIEDNIKIFNTKRTMADILKFGNEIKKTYKEMEKYCLDKPYSN